MTRSSPGFRLSVSRLTPPLLAFAALLGVTAGAEAQSAVPVRTRMGSIVAGRVHTADGAPIAGARVAVAGLDASVTSDTAGEYVLRQLPAGVDTLEVTRRGYEPLTLAVIVPEQGGAVSVDLLLAAAPVALPTVRVTRARSRLRNTPPELPGEWSWDGDAVGSDVDEEPDVLHLLGAVPGMAPRPDGTGTRFLGAGTPPTRVLVDGMPVWSAAHAGGLMAGVAPDVVGEVRLHDGTAAARYGATGTGVLDVQTGEAAVRRPVWGVAITPVSARVAWGSPLQLGRVSGSMLVAARRSGPETPLGAFTSSRFADPWSDLSGALSLRSRRSELRVIGLVSSDRLRVNSGAFENPGTADTARSTPEESADGGMRFPWHTMTVGAVWTERRDDGELQIRSWRSTLDAARDLSGTGSVRRDTAASYGIALEGIWNGTRAGASLESISTAYSAATPMLSAESLQSSTGLRRLGLHSAPTVLAAFAERRLYAVADRWVLTAGVRASALAGASPALEPRLALATRLPLGSRLTVGYARSHEYTQSLWSGSPALDALTPVPLPVAAHRSDVPTLRTDLLTSTLATRASSHVRVVLAAFERSFNSLLLNADPGKGRAPDRFTVADGRESGASLAASGAVGAATWATSYTMTRVNATEPVADEGERRATVQDATGTITLPFRATDLQVAWWIGSPQPAPGESFDVGVQGDGDRDAGADRSVLARDERVVTGAVSSAEPFPPYFRLDLTAAHRWRTSARGELVGSLTLANALDRSNLALSLVDPGEGAHALDLAPRSLIARLSWRVR